MGKKTKIILISLAILIAFSFIKNSFAQFVIESVVSKAAHLPLRIGSTHVGIARGKIVLKNMRLRNPRAYPDKWLLDAPLVSLDYDWLSLWKGRAHFEEIRLNIREITVIKNAKGELNVDALKGAGREKKKAQARKAPAKPVKMMIDKLYLTIGRVVYKDYSQGPVPTEQVFDIQIQDRVYSHIDDPEQLVHLVVFQALTNTAVAKLANLDLGVFKEGASGALNEGLGFVSNGAGSVEDTAKEIFSLFK